MKPLIKAMAKPATLTLKVYNDPGHGWIACRRSLLEQLGILHKISSYSYQSPTGQTVYCEEDCDGSLLVQTLKARGFQVNYDVYHTNRQSRIRSNPRFSATSVAQEI
jgi:hypothetical protein